MVDNAVFWVIKILAALTSLGMICSPALSIFRIHNKRDVGVASVIPLASLLANTHNWVLYGYMVKNWFPIFWVFVFGDLAALSYIAVYWRYTTERRYVLRVLVVVAAFLLVTTTYAVVGGLGYLGQSRGQVGSTLGIICDVVAVCLYGAPMEKLVYVLKYKSAAFINVHMVLAVLSNNVMWIIYGAVADNWYIISPNMLLIAVNSFTLVLYLVFNPKTHPLPTAFILQQKTPTKVPCPSKSPPKQALVINQVPVASSLVLRFSPCRHHWKRCQSSDILNHKCITTGDSPGFFAQFSWSEVAAQLQ